MPETNLQYRIALLYDADKETPIKEFQGKLESIGIQTELWNINTPEGWFRSVRYSSERKAVSIVGIDPVGAFCVKLHQIPEGGPHQFLGKLRDLGYHRLADRLLPPRKE